MSLAVSACAFRHCHARKIVFPSIVAALIYQAHKIEGGKTVPQLIILLHLNEVFIS